MSKEYLKTKKCLLFMAHPGHELRIHHTIEVIKPIVFILTDGSGRSNISRLPSTDLILEKLAIEKGSFYGLWTDAYAYQSILKKNIDEIERLSKILIDYIIAHNIECVIGDALEGYNPSHDLCRYVLNAAVAHLDKKFQIKVDNHEFLLKGRPDGFDPELKQDIIKVNLDGDAWNRKLWASKAYEPLEQEVREAFQMGDECFKTECFRAVNYRDGLSNLDRPTYYDLYGKKRVAAGYYQEPLNSQKHMLPIIQELCQRLELDF